MRADRLGLADAPVELGAETNVEDILATLSTGSVPRFVVIDSIQTVYTPMLESIPGSLAQVRGSSSRLMQFAKTSGAAASSSVTSPRTASSRAQALEHWSTSYSSSRATGRPTGSARAQEPVRVDRRDRRLLDARHRAGIRRQPVGAAPAERPIGAPGVVVVAGVDGARPLLVEIQALVAPASLGRRAAPSSAGIRTGCRGALAVLKPMPGSGLAAMMSISTLRAAFASRNRRPISRSRPPSSPPSRTPSCPWTASSSAKSACPEPSGRCPTRDCEPRKQSGSASPALSPRRVRRKARTIWVSRSTASPRSIFSCRRDRGTRCPQGRVRTGRASAIYE